MPIFNKPTRLEPLLRVVFELNHAKDEHASLVSVERVDGLIELRRFQSYRGEGPWIPEMCEPGDPSVEWFQRDWEGLGAELIGEDLDKVQRLVIEGRMYAHYYNNPIEGAGWDVGFTVERIVRRVKRRRPRRRRSPNKKK